MAEDNNQNNNQNTQSVRRIMPQSGLDFNMMLTDTMYGSRQIGAQLQRQINNRAEEKDPEVMEAWELLSFYTRDLRLSNIGDREFVYCQYYLDLAGDCLREGYMESFAKALALAVTVLELAQSKGGFLRKRQNTLTQESYSGELEPQKKKLLSLGKSKGGN